MDVESTLPQPAERYLPHRKPMALLTRILAIDEGVCRTEAQVAAGDLFVDTAGRLEPVALVEMIAQSYAALRGYLDCHSGLPVREGFLVGVRKLHIHGAVQAGDRLEITVRTVAEIDGFAVADGEIRRGTDVIATGNLKLWIPEPGAQPT